MELNQAEIESAASLIGTIDSGERGIFLDTVNTENQVEVKVFGHNSVAGVFFSCLVFGGLRMHIAFETDTDGFNAEIASLVQCALVHSGFTSCLIWIQNENTKIVEYLKARFHIQPDCGAYYYASIEFIMRREMFGGTTDKSGLVIRPYEEKHIDDYLLLLDEAMTFASPPANFRKNKKDYAKRFAELAENKSFEAFWYDCSLIGLYWRKNAGINILAVADNHQRKGYGSIILTRAIEMVFENTAAEYAYLYAVDWNGKGQSFYRKYAMEQNGHSCLLRLNNCAV